MNQAFDPFNIILLVAAIVVVFKLRSVLGSRTGHERNYDPFSPSQTAETETREDNVIPLPGHEGELAKAGDEAESEPIWTGYADEGSDLANGLQQVGEADRSFAPGEFLEGAKIAYEMIVIAFAEGDKKSLKSLLTTDVYKGFAKAIDQRASDGETLDYKFVGIDNATLAGSAMVRRKANVTVKFVSEMISATRDVTGDVIEGDPKQIREVTDIWTFERDTASRDPNWKLSATEATD
ncbi:MAG: Tim44/TimA family putative adaptor protein [Hyphomicrobiales bacterium]|nr:Tim44/TimA family putative adaptor protein [Hyphomicrobiales bacterium]